MGRSKDRREKWYLICTLVSSWTDRQQHNSLLPSNICLFMMRSHYHDTVEGRFSVSRRGNLYINIVLGLANVCVGNGGYKTGLRHLPAAIAIAGGFRPAFGLGLVRWRSL